MTELFHEATAWYNLPMTVLLCLVVIYWIVASIGVFGDGFEFDLDADTEIDADGDLSGHGGGSIFAALLRFVNVDQVPVMIVISIMAISMWVLSIVGNFFFTGAGSVVAAVLVGFASFVLSLFIAKAVTAPMARVLQKMKDADKETQEPIIGRTGIVRSGSVSTDLGQVEIEMRGAPLLINVRVREGNARLKKGDECLVIDEDEKTGAYFVRAL
ncbi:MAG: hypothetical protein ACI9R3_003399 [Verrucomicrobiales bacterium]|jgi:hypothetical protein